MARGKTYILSVALITLVTLGIGGVLWSREPPPLVIEPSKPSPTAEPSPTSEPSDPSEPSVTLTEWRRGADDAVITIDVFIDCECPACRETSAVALETMHWYSKYTEMVFHHYPLSEYSQIVSEALEAAGEQGKFWEFHDRIISGSFPCKCDLSGLKECAAEVGLDMQKFSEALDTRRFKEKVELALQEAIARGVTHATIFVNGREYHKYPPKVADISGMIAEELEKIRQGGG